MAKHTEVRLIDDLSAKAGDEGVAADETVEFAVDGKAYEIDLAASNATRLRDALAEFIAAGRLAPRTSGSTKARKASSAGDSERNQAIRQWAAEQGITVKPRGRLNKELIAKYDARNDAPAVEAPQPELAPAL